MSLPSRIAVVFAAGTCLSVHGCTGETGDGGAVEASWNLRDFDGTSRDCDKLHIEEVWVRWKVGLEAKYLGFPCSHQHGVTDFTVPEGAASLWLEPMCAGQTPPLDGTYETPPAIVRMITAGDVVTLDTQVIQVKPGVCP